MRTPQGNTICDLCGTKLQYGTKQRHFKTAHPMIVFNVHRRTPDAGGVDLSCGLCKSRTPRFRDLVHHYCVSHPEQIEPELKRLGIGKEPFQNRTKREHSILPTSTKPIKPLAILPNPASENPTVSIDSFFDSLTDRLGKLKELERENADLREKVTKWSMRIVELQQLLAQENFKSH